MIANDKAGLKRFAPSPIIQKILALIVILALVAGGIVWLVRILEDKKMKKEIQAQNDLIRKANEYPDSDGDGVPDWEEILLGFNPRNPDSDGDGVPDGVVISALKQSTAGEKLVQDLQAVSETTRLGLALAGTIENDTSRGIIDNTTVFSNVYKTTDQALASKENSYKPYTNESFDVKVPDDNPMVELESYIINTERIVAPVIPMITNLVPLVQAKFQPGATEPSALDAKTAISLSGYENKLLGIVVPTPLVDIHLAFLNSTATIRAISAKPVALDATERATDLIFLQNAMVAFTDAYDTMMQYKSFFQ